MKSAFIVSIVVLALAGSVRMQTAQPGQNGGPTGMISNALSAFTGTLSRAFSGMGQQQPQQQPNMLGGNLNQLLSRQGSQLGGGQIDPQTARQLSSLMEQAAKEIQQVQQQLQNGQLLPSMRQQGGLGEAVSNLLQDVTAFVRNLLQLGGGRNMPMNNDLSQMLQQLQQNLPLGGPQGLSRNPSLNGMSPPSPGQFGEAAQNFLGNLPGGLGGNNGAYGNMQPQQGGSPMNPSNLFQQGFDSLNGLGGGMNRLPSGLSRSNSLNNNMMSPPQMQQQQGPMNAPASSAPSGGAPHSP